LRDVSERQAEMNSKALVAAKSRRRVKEIVTKGVWAGSGLVKSIRIKR